jgi:hypothetical protein
MGKAPKLNEDGATKHRKAKRHKKGPYGSFSFLLKNYENLLISKNMHKRDKL